MKNNQLQVFENKEFGKLEILMIENKPFFPATDCAAILGYSNPRKAIIDHCMGVTKRDSLTTGSKQGKNYILEGDLYRLIIRSKLPAAVKFERWVFDEVLPTIRKHGAYINDAILEEAIKSQDFALELFQKLQAEKGKTEALLDKVEALAPKARYYDTILQSSGVVQVSLIAKGYGMTAVVFNRLLHELGVQFRMGTTWVLYKRHADQGFTKSRTYVTPSGIGVVHTCWTQKGRLFLYETLCAAGVFPVMDAESAAM